MKIAEKLEECSKNGQVYFSFEYFPPKTEEVGAIARDRRRRRRAPRQRATTKTTTLTTCALSLSHTHTLSHSRSSRGLRTSSQE